MVSMNERKMIFLYPKTELEQIEVLKKHIARIQKNENLPVVLVLKELSFRQKEYLIREKIPFIVDGKQIYLPFMAVCLQERCSAEKKTTRRNTSIGADASTAFHLWRRTRTIHKSSCKGLGTDTYFYIAMPITEFLAAIYVTIQMKRATEALPEKDEEDLDRKLKAMEG